jgi:hypothetical protein
MVDDYPKINLSEIVEQLIENNKKLGSNIIPTLHLYVEESTSNIVKERAPAASSLLDELINKLRKEFYDPKSNSEPKPYGQLFASKILSNIGEYVKTYIHLEDPELEWKVYRLIDGLEYLLKDNALNDIYETFMAILKGKFEDPYESPMERYERYYKHLHPISKFPYQSFREQLSKIIKEQASEYIRRGIIALMSVPSLGILTEKNKLESLLKSIKK